MTKPADVPYLIALQRKIYPGITPWTLSRFNHQISVFPRGQFVAEQDGQLVGCASSLIVKWDKWAVEHTWKDITASGSFDTHDPSGRTLYGAEVFVAPDKTGYGIGHALYEARRRLCRRLNLKRIIACGRIPGYQSFCHEMPATLYAQKVVWGDLQDPVLSFQLREGFRYCGIVEGYLPEDLQSCGFAALIVWLNPDYQDT